MAALISNLAIRFFRKLNVDDTLDVFPSHGIGGITGMILTALFASEVGLIYGETETFIMHLIAILLVVFYTLTMSYFLFKLVNVITPLRVREDQEERGLDASQHGEHFI